MDAVTVDRAVEIDDVCAVKVTLKNKVKVGTYTLLTVPSGALSGKTFSLSLVNETENAVSARLVASDTVLSLETCSMGMVILLR